MVVVVVDRMDDVTFAAEDIDFVMMADDWSPFEAGAEKTAPEIALLAVLNSSLKINLKNRF